MERPRFSGSCFTTVPTASHPAQETASTLRCPKLTLCANRLVTHLFVLLSWTKAHRQSDHYQLLFFCLSEDTKECIVSLNANAYLQKFANLCPLFVIPSQFLVGRCASSPAPVSVERSQPMSIDTHRSRGPKRTASDLDQSLTISDRFALRVPRLGLPTCLSRPSMLRCESAWCPTVHAELRT